MSPRHLLGSTPFTAVIAFLSLTVASTKFFDEDALIIFRFARNLARHGEFTFNLGDPTYSITCPGWGLLVGATSAAIMAPEAARWVAIGLSTSCACIALVLVHRELQRFGSRSAALGSLVVALDPNLVWSAAVGNEAPAFVLVLLLVLREWSAREPSGPRPVRLAVLIAVGYLLRPEAVLLVPAVAIALARGGAPGWLRDSLTVAILSLVFVTPWLVFAQLHFGDFVPLTVRAKNAVHHTTWVDTVRFLALQGAKTYAWGVIVLAAALLVSRRTPRIDARRALLLGWIVLLLGFYTVGLRESAIANRYLLILGPFVTLLVLDIALSVSRDVLHTPRRFVGLFAWIGVLIAVNLVAFSSRERRLADYLPYVEACRWLESNVHDDSRVYVGLLGGIAWFTDLEAVDNGIVSDEALAWRRGEMSQNQLIARLEPDYVVVLQGTSLTRQLEVVYESEPGPTRQFAVLRFDADRIEEDF